MLSIGLLLSWMVVGIAAAMMRPHVDEERLAWAPIAMVLGPMWLVVSSERRRTDVA